MPTPATADLCRPERRRRQPRARPRRRAAAERPALGGRAARAERRATRSRWSRRWPPSPRRAPSTRPSGSRCCRSTGPGGRVGPGSAAPARAPAGRRSSPSSAATLDGTAVALDARGRPTRAPASWCVRRRRRRRRPRPPPDRRADAGRAGPAAGAADQHRPTAYALAGPGPRAAGARAWPARCSTSPAAGARSGSRSARRLDVGTHLREGRRGRTGPDAATLLHVGTPGFDFAQRRGLGRAHRLERQPHPLRRAALHRRAGDRRRRAAAAGRGRARRRRVVRDARGSTPRTGPASTRSRAASTASCGPGPHHPGPDRPVTINVWEAVYFDHDNHAKLRRAGPAGRRGRGRALRARRRLVRRPARRLRRARRLDRLPRRLARRPAPAGRRGHRGSACSSGCGSSPRWSTRTPTWPGRTPSGSWRRAAGCRSRPGASR